MDDPGFFLKVVGRKALITVACLVVVNIIVWILAVVAAREYPSLLGSMVIAYTLGLRHAVDADHLAAIDNVTRKLIFQASLKSPPITGQSAVTTAPVCVGLFFSLGHSTIVIVVSIALVITATAIQGKLEAFGETGGIIGTSVSAAFLFLIGFINLFVLIQLGKELRTIHRTGEYRYQDPIKETLDGASHNTFDKDGGREDGKTRPSRFQPGGLFSRIFRPLFNLIDRSWKMYPLGVLFGLGFDTATEVGLLGIAATTAHAGFPIVVILIFPALFTAGMSLIDTLDGIIMANAYSWALVNPVKKLWYSFVVTFLGVLVAFVVGIVELLALLSEELHLEGSFWNVIITLSHNFGVIGYVIVGAFIGTWVFAVLFYKYGPIKDLERRVVIIEGNVHGEHELGDIEKGTPIAPDMNLATSVEME